MLSLQGLSGLRGRFVQLCRDLKVVNESKQWVHVDRLWYEVEARTSFAQIVADYVRALMGSCLPEETIILTPDTISSSYGVAPLVFIAAHELKCRAAVWQEVGDFARGKPLLIGPDHRDLKCIVLQDVIRHGTTILKILPTLQPLRWDLVAYACFVMNSQYPEQLERTKREYRERTGCDLNLQYLVTAADLRE